MIWIALLFTLVFIWQMIVLLVGIWPARKMLHNSIRLGKWIALVPAHNEEKVIANTVKGLFAAWTGAQGDLRVVIIADNCTDGTAREATMNGAEVWERCGRPGKQHALKWAFERLLGEEDRNAVVTVIDADNRVEKGYFENLMHGLYRADVVQAYLKTLNTGDNLQTRWYGLMFAFVMRFVCLGRERLGRSGVLGGTGWAMRLKVLEGCPWDVTSLTDDLEYSIKLRLAGYRVRYVAQASIQDEKPIGFMVGVRQRLRWARGQWQCFIKYFLKLIVKDFELALYVAFPLFGMASLILIFFYGVSVKGFLFIAILYFSVCVLERLPGALPGLILLIPYFFLGLVLNAFALITVRNYSWQRTPHKGVNRL